MKKDIFFRTTQNRKNSFVSTVNKYTCKYVCVHANAYVYMQISMYICKYVCIHANTYVNMQLRRINANTYVILQKHIYNPNKICQYASKCEYICKCTYRTGTDSSYTRKNPFYPRNLLKNRKLFSMNLWISNLPNHLLVVI